MQRLGRDATWMRPAFIQVDSPFARSKDSTVCSVSFRHIYSQVDQFCSYPIPDTSSRFRSMNETRLSLFASRKVSAAETQGQLAAGRSKTLVDCSPLRRQNRAS